MRSPSGETCASATVATRKVSAGVMPRCACADEKSRSKSKAAKSVEDFLFMLIDGADVNSCCQCGLLGLTKFNHEITRNNTKKFNSYSCCFVWFRGFKR